MYNKIFISFIFALTSFKSMAQTFSDTIPYIHSPKRETRAVWLTTLANLDWPKTYANSLKNIEYQKMELISILDKYQQANINTVLLQTRIRATTIYPSAIEPWDKCITGIEGKAPENGYDPLEFAIEECHKRGMAIHAWIVSIPAGNKKSIGVKQLQKKGLKLHYISKEAYLDPADGNVSHYLAKICTEIVRHYDVDGINLDYIRYPDSWHKPTNKYGDRSDDRCAQITKIVRTIHDQVKFIKPWVRISCSPIGKYADLKHYSSKNYNARDRFSQEAQEWLRLGLMDQLYPMQYFRGNNYYPFLADWNENRHKKEIVSGIGTYLLSPKEGSWTLNEVKRQMNISRSLGIGQAHFRSFFLTNNTQGILDYEKLFNISPAIPPVLYGYKYSIAAPSYYNNNNNLIISDKNSSIKILKWKGTSPYYNIYASKKFPVDINKAENLLYTKFIGKSLVLKDPSMQRNFHFAITAMDRYDNESVALQENIKEQLSPFFSTLLTNDNNKIILPYKLAAFRVNYYIVETLQGNIIQQISYNPKVNYVLISPLPNGMYRLKAMFPNYKYSVNIGFFLINN
jgi:hypothetical protein